MQGLKGKMSYLTKSQNAAQNSKKTIKEVRKDKKNIKNHKSQLGYHE